MDLVSLLGDQAEDLLGYEPKIKKEQLSLPGPDFIDRVISQSDRSPQVLRSLQSLYDHGRLAGTGYVSILPVDQGIEHSGAASFAPNPAYFDPKNIVELAIEGGTNAVASTFGVLAMVSRTYAHKIPFIVKINHNELLTYPNGADQVMYGSVDQAYRPGRGRCRCDHLLRLRPGNSSAARDSRGVRAGSSARHGRNPPGFRFFETRRHIMTNSLLPSLFGNGGKTPVAFQSLHKEIDRVFDEFRDIFPGNRNGEATDQNGNIIPKLDVSETDDEVKIAAELPGVEEKDIDISVSGNLLTLKGEKSSKREESEKDYKLIERSYGSFVRTLPFSFDMDSKQVSAKLADGVLNITIKKPAEVKEKTQKIKISKSA